MRRRENGMTLQAIVKTLMQANREIRELKESLSLTRAQITALRSENEQLTGCLLEMSGRVYA